jgi:hypothetical protein
MGGWIGLGAELEMADKKKDCPAEKRATAFPTSE